MFDPMSMVAIAGSAVVLAAWSFKATHDRLARLDERCATAWADIDAQLKHRHNIVPGLIEVTRAMAAHEKDILTEVCQAHAAAAGSAGGDQERRLLSERIFGQSVSRLVEVSMAYPEIKANGRFQELARELAHTEEMITAARRFYNLAVGEYNAARRSLTGKLVGRVVTQATRQPFDLGIDRIVLDEPMTVRL